MLGGLVTLFFIIHWETGTHGAAWAEWLTTVATVPDEHRQALTEESELTARTEVYVRYLRTKQGQAIMPLSPEVVESVREVLERFEAPAGSEPTTTEFARRKVEDVRA